MLDRLLIKQSSAQNRNWIGRLNGARPYGRSIAVDSDGNSYIAGSYQDTAGTISVQMFLTKYDISGTLQWSKQIGNSSGNVSDEAYSVAVDGSGNVYLAGNFVSSSLNYFSVIKLNNAGNILWQRRVSTSDRMYAYSVAVDSGGNVYAVGASNLGGAPLVKYNSSGTLQWQRRIGTATAVVGYGVGVDSSGNVYVTGKGSSLYFVIKYNSSGTLQWQRQLTSGGGNNFGVKIAVSPSGDVYLGGSTTSYSTLFIAKYDTSGNIQWQRKLSGTNDAGGQDIAIDVNGNAYINGYCYLGTSGGFSVNGYLIAKYNSSGALQWQRIIKRTGLGANLTGCGVSVDSIGNFYVTGYATPNDGSGLPFAALSAKLPDNGSLTGTYTVGNFTDLNYGAASFTDAAGTLVDAVGTLADAAGSYSSSASTLPISDSTLTSTVTTI